MQHWMKNLSLGLLLSGGVATMVGCGAEDDERSVGQRALDAAGATLDGSGLCATLLQLEEVCPADLDWDNHGQYVSCVAKYLAARVEREDVDEREHEGLVALAAKSSIGKPAASKKGRGLGHGGSGGEGALDEVVSPFAERTAVACAEP